MEAATLPTAEELQESTKELLAKLPKAKPLAANETDFGSGFWYPLALFLGHQMQLIEKVETYRKMRAYEYIRRYSVGKIDPAIRDILAKYPNAQNDQLLCITHELEKLGVSMDTFPSGRVLFSDDEAAGMWIYGACDHLYDFDTELAPTPAIKKLAEKFRDKAFNWRLPIGMDKRITVEDAFKLIEDAQKLFFMLDKHMGNKPKKARYN